MPRYSRRKTASSYHKRKRAVYPRRRYYARRKWSASTRVSKLYKPETKYYDGTAGGGGVGQWPSGWNRYDLSCPIIQGTTAVTRLGNNIIAKSLGISFDITRNTSSTPAFQRVRYMVIDYVRSEGSIPTAAEVFQTTGVFLPQRLLSWSKEFRILVDRVVTVDTAARNNVTVRIRRKLNLLMKYQDNSGTTGGQVDHQLFFVAWCEVASNPPSLNNFSWRLTFTDP